MAADLVLVEAPPRQSLSRGRAGLAFARRCGAGAFWIIFGMMLALVPFGCTSGDPVQQEAAAEVGTDVGDRAPGLTGVLPDGSDFDLEDQLSGVAVLIFYRSAECGLCRLQLEQVQRHLTAYEYQGARVIGVTLDSPATSGLLVSESAIEFDLVSVGRDVFEDWEIIGPGDEAPLPATFILNPDGVVQHRHIGRNAADRSSDAGILTVLETLRQ